MKIEVNSPAASQLPVDQGRRTGFQREPAWNSGCNGRPDYVPLRQQLGPVVDQPGFEFP